MGIFTNQNVKKLFCVLSAGLMCLALAAQVMVYWMTTQYKQQIIFHDYAIAGYLYQQNVPKSQLVSAFTVEKNQKVTTEGQNFLQQTGYSVDSNVVRIPEIQSIRHDSAMMMLALSFIISFFLLAFLYLYFVRQDKKFEIASDTVLKFIHGNTDIRLDDNEEGRIAHLFHSVNVMATFLTAHIIKEKQIKEFLKNTISDISHQLKTPLTALKMYNEIIADENRNFEVVDNFNEKSRNQLERMEYLILNLLKLARFDAGAIELVKQKHPLKGLLECIVLNFSTKVQLENKSLALNFSSETDTALNCDKDWLLEAISNIVKNALDHTTSGDVVRILCDVTPVLIIITIQDNGEGIHPEDIHHIFTRFYRSRFSKDKNGTGIGLTLSKFIIEKHGGSITVESELGKGTAFHLTFPNLTNL